MSNFETSCAYCGAILTLHISRRIHQHNFCNSKHMGAWKKAQKITGTKNPQWNRIQLTCETCGKIIYKAPSTAAKVKHHFCSTACCGDWATKNKRGVDNKLYARITVPCAQCDKLIERPPHKILRSKNFFCCIECRGVYHTNNIIGENNPTFKRVMVNCVECGAAIQAIPFRIKNHAKQFCNAACHGMWQSKNLVGETAHNWKGGYKEYYGPNWNRQRRAARQRDNYKCQHCNKTEHQLKKELDVHHVVPFRTFGYVQGENERYKDANRLENLISLCNSCHQHVERGSLSVQLKLL